MSTAAMEAEREPLSVVARVAEAVRGAAHMSHEARLLHSVAADVVEDAPRAGRRALRRRMADARDLRDEVIYRVKRQPLQAVTAAVAIGAVLGFTTGWIAHGAVACKQE